MYMVHGIHEAVARYMLEVVCHAVSAHCVLQNDGAVPTQHDREECLLLAETTA